jgi:RimJ/RimL family protein N-acetyltransferase
MSDVLLETERLILRRLTAQDADALVELDGDPEVMRFVTGGRPTARAEIENEILPALLAYYERPGGYGFWAAVEKPGGAFLGWFHLRPGPGAPPDEPELGYRLRRSAWGRGYATEGSRALVRRAFAELGARRVTASATAANHASRRVMEKAGLRLVGSFALALREPADGDGDGDTAAVEYALTRAEWEAAQG